VPFHDRKRRLLVRQQSQEYGEKMVCFWNVLSADDAQIVEITPAFKHTDAPFVPFAGIAPLSIHPLLFCVVRARNI